MHYPSDKALTDYSASLNVLREGEKQLLDEYEMDKLRKESLIDLTEDIKRVQELFCSKLGRTRGECCAPKTRSDLAHLTIQEKDVGWRKMIAPEQVEKLKGWLEKQLANGVLNGKHQVDEGMAEALGITQEELDAELVDLRGEAAVDQDAEGHLGVGDIREDSDDDDDDVPLGARRGGRRTAGAGAPRAARQRRARQVEEASSDQEDDDEEHEADSDSDRSVDQEEEAAAAEEAAAEEVDTSSADNPSAAAQTEGRDDESDEDDDVSLAGALKLKAKNWVEFNARNTKLDKTQDAYLERVVALLQGGTDDRATGRRTRSAGQRFREGGQLWQAVLTYARKYYDKENQCCTTRPWKVVGHEDFPTLGRHFQCQWRDPGWDPQDVFEMKPADFVAMWPDLLENYIKVIGGLYAACSVCLGSGGVQDDPAG